jgi:diadenosine tetraphosphate (Ap4A) HIT family hydrolase
VPIHVDRIADRLIGFWLPLLARTVSKVTGVTDYNIVQNNGKSLTNLHRHCHPSLFNTAAHDTRNVSFQKSLSESSSPLLLALLTHSAGARAAQVVPHVHFHIIPRPETMPEIKNKSWTMFGRGQRDELDDEDGVRIAGEMRRVLREEVEAMSWSIEEKKAKL